MAGSLLVQGLCFLEFTRFVRGDFAGLVAFDDVLGLSLEAATLWPLIFVGLVCSFTILPVLWPPDESQETLSPLFKVFVIASCSSIG
jgi:hypothetical protein